jgi:hypothetical protein
MIIGKKTSETDKPFNFVMPFDTFFSMTGNLVTDSKEEGLTANTIQDINLPMEECVTYINVYSQEVFNTELISYTRLGIKADFKSWIKNAVVGNYGLQILLYTEQKNTVNAEATEQVYTYLLDSSKMYGNPYNFESYYNQELVLDISNIKGNNIKKIDINFYQLANFYDTNGNPIPSHTKGFLKYETSDNYIRYGDITSTNVIGEVYLVTAGDGYYKADGD